MKETRTKNAIRNVKTAMFVQLINKCMAFVVRTFFIKYLNTEYLGVNGLFSNILTILSFAELGIGSAIIFNMYKPVAVDDKEKIKSLMNLYKKSYNIIGIIVFVLGLCVIPFMDLIIKDVPDIKENIIFIYLLYLFNTSSSYFFTYKKSIIYAYQKQSIINKIDSLFYLIKSIFEIVFLILTKNFIIYLLIQILGTFIENIIVSIKANKMYPYLKDKNIKPIDKNEKQKIFSNVKSLVIYQFGGVIMTGTDNILISSLVNVSSVGLCSNYTLIINSVKSIVSNSLNGLNASVGNLNAVGSKEKKEEIFYQLTLINHLIYSICAVGFIVLLNPFIEIWVGKEYVLELSIPVVLAINVYIDGIRSVGYTYRTTLGLFEKSKITPYIGAISNIILSILLCKFLGLKGIIIATGISTLISYSCMDPYLIHKYEFKTSSIKYYKKFIVYFIYFIVNILITTFVCNLIDYKGIVLKGIIVIILSNLINLILVYRKQEFKEIKKKFINPILKRIKRK